MKKFLIDQLNVLEYPIQCLFRSNNLIPGSPMIPTHANIVNVLCIIMTVMVDPSRDGQITKDNLGGGNRWRELKTETTYTEPADHLNHTPVYIATICGSLQIFSTLL
ncbi:hypothetical protein F5146DRAFT_1138638 [Armillaria mellea]|nr:hypothetical protein F5146DRAFT_1138638 [Armillaria mellea]